MDRKINKKNFGIFLGIVLVFFGILIYSKNVEAAASTQCTGVNSTTGAEIGCTNTNDTAILSGQCQAQYSSTAICGSMTTYLNQMQTDCQSKNPPGINCSLISANGIYGTQASAFANYLESNPSSTDTSTTAGMLDIPKNTGLADPAGGIGQILQNFMLWLLGIIGIIALIAFIISGLQYFMAAGSETQMQTAKRNMAYAIIGVIVALAGFIIIQAIDTALRANSISF